MSRDIDGVCNGKEPMPDTYRLVKVRTMFWRIIQIVRRLAAKGYEIAGGYDEAAFCDMPYGQQYRYLQEAQELVETITGKPMRVFGSRYFAYDENTLKAADALGIEYILARGTQDVAAMIFDPVEYDVNVISVTNVENGEMGRGSLCDYSLWPEGGCHPSLPKSWKKLGQKT